MIFKSNILHRYNYLLIIQICHAASNNQRNIFEYFYICTFLGPDEQVRCRSDSRKIVDVLFDKEYGLIKKTNDGDVTDLICFLWNIEWSLFKVYNQTQFYEINFCFCFGAVHTLLKPALWNPLCFGAKLNVCPRALLIIPQPSLALLKQTYLPWQLRGSLDFN